MAGAADRWSPSVLSLAVAWALAFASDIGWSVGLYNYDGEMGFTPPPSIWATSLTAAVTASVLVAVAWVAWRLRGSVTWRFSAFLAGAFTAKGLVFAGLEELSLLIHGPAPFTRAGWYRGEALSVATGLVSGVLVALIVRAVEARRAPVDDMSQHFE
jgi:hypothetical protein